ncbi:hypothetical protein SlsnVgp100 [Spodoptera littoralis nucleopolyhedrovirus]|uniref:Uncharacterized protein n=1 Tax=Spodoptera littoralis nuclear polyhedrosis virus TaxID=10456 RepID=M1JTI5_NPVSL|nr:hypothetical protein SlsnVgp100 [Spodoptera littoralis nucleopolyhedrovirus]AGE89955.1 hypothetical protein SlsnVgp100 [Spodoptera littoralis nucleopolyhedrovirus]
MCINCEYRKMKQQQQQQRSPNQAGCVVGAMISLLFYNTVPSSSKLHGCIECVGMKYCTCNKNKRL